MSEPTMTVLSGGVPLLEILANYTDGLDKRAMVSVLAQHPNAVSIECSYRPDGSASTVTVGLGNPEVRTTFFVGANGELTGVSENVVLEIKLTPAQHLLAIETAIRSFEGDGSVTSSTRTLLLALAAYAADELKAKVQQETRADS